MRKSVASTSCLSNKYFVTVYYFISLWNLIAWNKRYTSFNITFISAYKN